MLDNAFQHGQELTTGSIAPPEDHSERVIRGGAEVDLNTLEWAHSALKLHRRKRTTGSDCPLRWSSDLAFFVEMLVRVGDATDITEGALRFRDNMPNERGIGRPLRYEVRVVPCIEGEVVVSHVCCRHRGIEGSAKTTWVLYAVLLIAEDECREVLVWFHSHTEISGGVWL